MATTTTNSYGQYCPITRAMEVIGERWSILILRDMVLGETRFNGLARGLPGLSRTLLAKRLRQLEMAGLVDKVGGEYLLTAAGQGLEPVIMGLGEWGARFAFDEPREDELDSELLVWWMHGRLDTTVLPDRRVVVHLRFRGDRKRFWIVVDAAGPSVCTSDPGFEVDLAVEADLKVMYEVWLGRRDMTSALRDGSVTVDGPRAMVRLVPGLFLMSPAAPFSQALR